MANAPSTPRRDPLREARDPGRTVRRHPPALPHAASRYGRRRAPIELSREGKIETSPASNRHGWVQSRLCAEPNARGGATITECAIQTTDGVRVADVAWMSEARLARHGMPDPLTVAPEICVEIKSPSNTRAEMDLKIRLYLEAGALEVWIADLDGNRSVHVASPP